MTPCEKKGYKEGHIFKVVRNPSLWSSGTPFIVLDKDDGSRNPKFVGINCKHKDGVVNYAFESIEDIVRVYPPKEEPEEPVETIELMGKTYDKTEIEEALSQVKAIS